MDSTPYIVIAQKGNKFGAMIVVIAVSELPIAEIIVKIEQEYNVVITHIEKINDATITKIGKIAQQRGLI